MKPLAALAARARQAPVFTSSVYSVRLRSPWPIPCLDTPPTSALCRIRIVRGSPAQFEKASKESIEPSSNGWFDRARLPGGAVYLHWPRLSEFIVAPEGDEIAVHPVDEAALEPLHAHLLGPVLSFALIKQGFDPFHATVVNVNGKAIALLGHSGYGKSTLAAAFLRAGHTLLTDDLLVLTADASGWVAHPGPARIKLFPEIAARLLGDHAAGAPLHLSSPKLLIPLDPAHLCRAPVRLHAMYMLSTPRSTASARVYVRPLTGRRACLALLSNTFNVGMTDRSRLASQLALVAEIIRAVPLKMIGYPRTIDALSAARDAILADVS